MKILRDPAEVRAWRRALPPERRVAMVPTMGFLHEGHLSLLREARRRVPVGEGEVVLTIFVNPTQFGPSEDLDRYPRDEEGDLAKARECGVDLAFCPLDPHAMYPSRSTWVDVEGLSAGLCGSSRPGHFRGVCTIVSKLWNLVRPDLALFGEKDYQQLAIIRRMHADLMLDGQVVGMPIVREPDGLAMSSRNANLDADARRDALALSRWLHTVRARFETGERRVDALLAGASEALAPGRPDYMEIVDAEDLRPIEVIERPALCALAVFVSGVRLIDNAVLRP
ncbi:pantoate--beta-alanine ligase [Paraliomyxa miuraensis]|uniref:pantoate--beta-alanine ligase n=1 Tax=Paraliomyxa miuraensis TaxID=376150 RepID=UPI00225057A5|nr:pantoate--beta-alanine ligase [Paraliomyxa miuraensis]MCX4245287.1 pantoate--beta-alanine ligase [Paraliomyxa miuraensis]